MTAAKQGEHLEGAMYGSAAMAVSPSIGAALHRWHGDTLLELSKIVDKAFCDAKPAGRNTWRVAVTF